MTGCGDSDSSALETGCRIGEILNVQFKQLRWDLNELHLSNRTTKGLRTRYLPLSQELRAMLELRKYDPDGEEFKLDAERRENLRRGPHKGPQADRIVRQRE